MVSGCWEPARAIPARLVSLASPHRLSFAPHFLPWSQPPAPLPHRATGATAWLCISISAPSSFWPRGRPAAAGRSESISPAGPWVGHGTSEFLPQQLLGPPRDCGTQRCQGRPAAACGLVGRQGAACHWGWPALAGPVLLLRWSACAGEYTAHTHPCQGLPRLGVQYEHSQTVLPVFLCSSPPGGHQGFSGAKKSLE